MSHHELQCFFRHGWAQKVRLSDFTQPRRSSVPGSGAVLNRTTGQGFRIRVLHFCALQKLAVAQLGDELGKHGYPVVQQVDLTVILQRDAVSLTLLWAGLA